MEDRVLQVINGLEEKIVRLTQELVQVPTVNPPGKESDIVLLLEGVMRKKGYT